MHIADGLVMLEIDSNLMGMPSVIYPTLLIDNDSVTLVDAGYPGQLAQFKEAIEQTGVPFSKLNKIIITHHDIDHIGALKEIKEVLPNLEVLAHEEEAPFIDGKKQPIKLAKLEAQLDSLPENLKKAHTMLKAGFQGRQVNVDSNLNDGEVLPDCGGIEVIFTPGHTQGHICLYLTKYKILIAGDLLAVEDSKLVKAPLFTEYDPSLTQISLAKLSKYNIEKVICYHGGLFIDNPNKHIAELIR